MTSRRTLYGFTPIHIIETGIIAFILSGMFWYAIAGPINAGGSPELFNTMATTIILSASLLYIDSNR